MSPTPGSSAELVVAAPAAGVKTPRSRLTFTATDGTLTPASVSFAIRRTSDSKYWNGATGAWGTSPVENAATQQGTSGTWTYAVTGESRRAFAGTAVVVEARAVAGAQQYVSAVTPQIEIR